VLRRLVLVLSLTLLSRGDPVLPPPLSGAVVVRRFDLQAELDARVQVLGIEQWRTGIAIRSCSDGTLVYGSDPDLPLAPASGMKLLVTACALAHWDSALVRELDTRLDSSDIRSRLHRANRGFVDSLGLDDRPEFPGYRHLVLANRESDNAEAEWMLGLSSTVSWSCRAAALWYR